MQIKKQPECEVIKKTLSKNQKDWIDYFNNKGEKMISAPDIYSVAKKGNKALMQSLRKDFDDSWEVTSTRIIYNKNNLTAEIIHDADSKVIKPKKYKLKIPILQGSFKKDSETEKYLQTLFDTKDNIDTILKVLHKFDKKREIRLWTPDQQSRKSNQVRSVVLYFDVFGRFGVIGYVWFDSYGGLSCGVIMDSASKKQSKSRGKSKCKK